MLKIVMFTGGRGSINLIRELFKYDHIRLSLIVNGYDDGKSTGEIRKFFKMLGPSDIRKNQEILMSTRNKNYEALKKLFQFRFPVHAKYHECRYELECFTEQGNDEIVGIYIKDNNLRKMVKKIIMQFLISLTNYERVSNEKFKFNDCSLANCLYAGAYELVGKNFDKTIDLFNIILNTRGSVIPTNIENKKLIAIRESGRILYSEAEIVELRSSVRIKQIFLVDEYPKKSDMDRLFLSMDEKLAYLNRTQTFVMASNRVIRLIKEADIIIYSPGTQHSSLYPSYMTIGIPEAICSNNKATKIFICNIGEDYETPDYSASELVEGAYKYLTKNISQRYSISNFMNCVLVNISRSEQKQSFRYIKTDNSRLDALDIPILYDKFEDSNNLGKHDAKKTMDVILDLYYKQFYGRRLHNHY